MKQYTGDVLIVDDAPDNLRVLSSLLTEKQYKVRSVVSGRLALTVAQEAQPDLILLDIKMPDLDGYQVCEYLKLNEATDDIPVIFLSALDAPIDKVRAFEVGGVDFITKPFHPEEVLVRIDTQLRLRKATQALQTINAELEERVRQRTIQLEQEISERRRVQEELLHRALHDDLTGLANRALLMKRLQVVLNRAQGQQTVSYAVLFLDCDRFKLVNDSLGHSVGDKLLVAIAGRIEACLPAGSTLARLGGDEFIALIERVTDNDSVLQIADYIQREVQLPFQLEQYEFSTSISIGIVAGHLRYQQAEHVLRDADTAMYQAKAAGKGRYHLFSAGLHHEVHDHFNLEIELKRALAANELRLRFQPIVDLSSGQLRGFEALLRWQHPERGLLAPRAFLSVAEASGVIELIDAWVLKTACRTLATWQLEALLSPPFTVSVNLSAMHFAEPSLIAQVDGLLDAHRVNGRFLGIEITEHSLMQQPTAAVQVLTQLQQRGIQISIDDFGTGYSSLSYLQ
ncbi:MAG: EAL domain-containing protein, partial [Cyanobacteria bacterium P01_A01_bin.135]